MPARRSRDHLPNCIVHEHHDTEDIVNCGHRGADSRCGRDERDPRYCPKSWLDRVGTVPVAADRRRGEQLELWELLGSGKAGREARSDCVQGVTLAGIHRLEGEGGAGGMITG